MAKIKSKNTTFERKFLRILSKEIWSEGFRYRLNVKSVYGKPDIVFKRQKIAIFLDSDFWHGWQYENWKKNLRGNKFWENKIESNIKRDIDVNKTLKKEGWKIIRIWEHNLKNLNFSDKKIKQIKELVKKS